VPVGEDAPFVSEVVDPCLGVPFTGGRRCAVEDAVQLAGHQVIVRRQPVGQVPELPYELFVGWDPRVSPAATLAGVDFSLRIPFLRTAVSSDVLVVIDRMEGSRVVAGIGLRPADRDPNLGMLGTTADDGLANPGDLSFHLGDRIG
jgi:hypothetical protein